MAIRKLRFAPCPFDAAALALDAKTLKKHWPHLHAGDQEPFPDARRTAALIKVVGKAPKGMDANGLSEQLQVAWLAFHRGDFADAYNTGAALGALGASVAVKALGIHTA